MKELIVYNTLSKEKELFTPLNKQEVRMYTCGPTVYHFAHIGNLRAYIFSDLLKRVLIYNDYDVKHVMNITDVGHLTSDSDEGQDKMEKGAQREGKSVWDVAEFYTSAFIKDIEALNIIPPKTWCKATDHIPEQIAQIAQIQAAGYTYQTSDGVYFDTSKLSDYGKLARLNIEELEGGKRVSLGEKKNKTDFALWKFSPEDEQRQMEWDSPWGRGFPGWHIECSAMATKYLGEQFDIHTGGIDHIPIHHTNEIAQAETALRKTPWVQYWMHSEFLVLGNKEIMAKSGDNFLTLSLLIDKGYKPLHYRYFCLTAHYRQQLTFNWEALEGAKNSYERLKNIVAELGSEEGMINASYKEQFMNAINDDLNMPQALAVLWEVLRDKELSSGDKRTTIESFDQVLGLSLLEEELVDVPEEITCLAEERETARQKRQWTRSDELREEIRNKGWDVADSKEGYKLKKQ